jgi:hypothetical protein
VAVTAPSGAHPTLDTREIADIPHIVITALITPRYLKGVLRMASASYGISTKLRWSMIRSGDNHPTFLVQILHSNKVNVT